MSLDDILQILNFGVQRQIVDDHRALTRRRVDFIDKLKGRRHPESEAFALLSNE